MFYGGAKEDLPRRRTRENIGYAYSFDGYHFIRYGGNPVAGKEAEPNAASFSEVHALYEAPFVYVFNTIRYLDPRKAPLATAIKDPTRIEDLGVQILVTRRPFRLAMPILNQRLLESRTTTDFSDCPPVALDAVTQVSLTAECRYAPGATAAMRIHVRSSFDGAAYDTSDVFTFENELLPGALARKTVQIPVGPRFIKVLVENPDRQQSVANVHVTQR